MRSGSDYGRSMPDLARIQTRLVTLVAVLAYHADDEIARARAEWLVALVVALALAVAVAAVLLRRRVARAAGPNWPSRIALALTLLLAPFIGLAPLVFVLPPFAIVPLSALGFALVGVVRRPARETAVALVAFAAAGLANAFAFSHFAACVATDACFH
jgi:hypothetical protein